MKIYENYECFFIKWHKLGWAGGDNMKVKIIVGIGIVALVTTLFIVMKPKSFEDEMIEKLN